MVEKALASRLGRSSEKHHSLVGTQPREWTMSGHGDDSEGKLLIQSRMGFEVSGKASWSQA